MKRKTLDAADAAVVKAMLDRGDHQHHVAAYFGVNSGRIAEIATGQSYPLVKPSQGQLPEPGPYDVQNLIDTIELLKVQKRCLHETVENLRLKRPTTDDVIA